MRTFSTRILHVFLAVVLCVSMAPHVAFADTVPTAGTTTQEPSNAPQQAAQPLPAPSPKASADPLGAQPSSPHTSNTSSYVPAPSAVQPQQDAQSIQAGKNLTERTNVAPTKENASLAQSQNSYGDSAHVPSSTSASPALLNSTGSLENRSATEAGADGSLSLIHI